MPKLVLDAALRTNLERDPSVMPGLQQAAQPSNDEANLPSDLEDGAMSHVIDVMHDVEAQIDDYVVG